MSCSIKKLALFLPCQTPFYTALFEDMKKGFEQAGFTVDGGPRLLDRKELLDFCQQFKPEAVFEMNRSRAQMPWFPKNIIHIGWIVDLFGHPDTYYNGSEILYFFEYRRAKTYWRKWYTIHGDSPRGVIDWLPPGYSPDSYFTEDIKPAVNFSFIGHIPLPWNREEFDRKLGDNVTFEDFYDCCKKPENTARFYRYGKKEIARLLGQNLSIEGQRLNYDVHVRIGRMLCRATMMRCLLSVNDSVRIYGPHNWQKWREFSSFYHSFLCSAVDFRRATLSSRIGVHEGYGTHFRLFDIMGTGRCVFFHNNPHRTFLKKECREIELLFEPDRHFIYFDADDVREKS